MLLEKTEIEADPRSNDYQDNIKYYGRCVGMSLQICKSLVEKYYIFNTSLSVFIFHIKLSCTAKSCVHLYSPPKVLPLFMYLGNELDLWKMTKHGLNEFEEDHFWFKKKMFRGREPLVGAT